MAAQARLEGGGPERGPRLSVARGRWMPAGPRPQSRGRPPPCPGPPDPQAGDRPPPGPPASTKWLTPSSGLGRRTQGSRRADLLFILPSARPFRCPGSERSRGRWKFLWIEHGAEARWAVWVGSGLPPHPVPHPLPPPSSPEHPFMPPLGVPSPFPRPPPPALRALPRFPGPGGGWPCWPRGGSLGPLPKFGRGRRTKGDRVGRPAPWGPLQAGAPSDLRILVCETGAIVQTRQAVCGVCLWVQLPENARDTRPVTGPARRQAHRHRGSVRGAPSLSEEALCVSAGLEGPLVCRRRL